MQRSYYRRAYALDCQGEGHAQSGRVGGARHECQHGLILGWEIMWTQSDVEMTIEIATKYRTEFENLVSMSFDRLRILRH